MCSLGRWCSYADHVLHFIPSGMRSNFPGSSHTQSAPKDADCLMALSAADKREIANMIAPILEAFTERMTTGRQVKSLEEQTLERLIQGAAAPYRAGTLEFPPPRRVPLEEQTLARIIETAVVPTKRKKAISKFNQAVKEGVAIVKASTSYGKKGVVNNPRKAFTAVTKTVSKVKRGKAAPKKGILGKVARAARKRFRGIGRRGLA